MSSADDATYQPGMSTYRLTVVETQRREITLYAWNPTDAVTHVMEHSGAEEHPVLHSMCCGPAILTVESVAHLSLNGPSKPTPAT
jgi:hypothetical protein